MKKTKKYKKLESLYNKTMNKERNYFYRMLLLKNKLLIKHKKWHTN